MSYVYILGSKSLALYVGVTSDLERRMYQHRNKIFEGHTQKYNISGLLYFEESDDMMSAIEREKQIKRWSRKKKLFLVELENPFYKDLSKDWEI